jgi:hypothetical protein
MKTKRTTGRKLVALRRRVFAMYGDECWLCGGGEADTIDHIVKLKYGGTDDLENLRPAHGRRTDNCVGNYSGLRPKTKHPGNYKVDTSKSYESNRVAVESVTDEHGNAWGDGWVKKTRGASSSTMFYGVAGMAANDPFITDWLAMK